MLACAAALVDAGHKCGARAPPRVSRCPPSESAAVPAPGAGGRRGRRNHCHAMTAPGPSVRYAAALVPAEGGGDSGGGGIGDVSGRGCCWKAISMWTPSRR